MQVLENRAPPLLAMIAVGAVMYLAAPYIAVFKTSNTLGIAAGVFFVLLGAAFGFLAVRELARHKTTLNPLNPDQASSLVTSGVFKISRNPMYVALALFLVAFAFFLRAPLTALLVPCPLDAAWGFRYIK